MNREMLKSQLKDILERSVGEEFPNLDEASALKEGMKLDSVDMLSMTIEIQSCYDISIETDEVAGIVTVGDVLDLLQKKLLTKEGTSQAA